MSGIKDSDNVDDLKSRLYQRGAPPEVTEREELTPKKSVLPRRFNLSGLKPQKQEEDFKPKKFDAPGVPTGALTQVAPSDPEIENMAKVKKKKRSYRLKVLLAGAAFFIFAMVVSSVMLLFGNNNISGENIAIAVTGPFTIGGGEVVPIQVGITNSNTVPIQSATLIVDYPPGTKAANETNSDLFTERLSLDTIDSGETINVPIRAVVFGEENDEKTVEVSIEYRVQGSNATFFKEADPLRFKISSSPIVFTVDNLKKVSSGQETEIDITIKSNAPTPLSEVLVKAEYPLGFDFTSSSPGPTNGQNMWLIENLEPESTKTITVKGVVVGKETDEYAINFSVGVPNERDRQNLASVFATAQTQFEIEVPFLGVDLAVNGQDATEVAIEPGQQAQVSITVTNSLSEAIYDTEIEVALGGNAFSVFSVNTERGYYDSTKKIVRWDVSNTPELESLRPGEKVQFSFTVAPRTDVGRSPQLTLNAEVKSRRVNEDRVTEMLVGAADGVVKITTVPVLRGEAGHNNGIFTDTGPIPPRVGVATTYTMSMMLQNGSNDVTDAVVVTSIPPYVEWLGETAGAGDVSYNSTNREITWNIGSLEAGAATFASFQISFEPRITQVGDEAILMQDQRAKATDRFTGATVRATNQPVTTRLSSEAGFGSDSGEVRN